MLCSSCGKTVPGKVELCALCTEELARKEAEDRARQLLEQAAGPKEEAPKVKINSGGINVSKYAHLAQRRGERPLALKLAWISTATAGIFILGLAIAQPRIQTSSNLMSTPSFAAVPAEIKQAEEARRSRIETEKPEKAVQYPYALKP